MKLKRTLDQGPMKHKEENWTWRRNEEEEEAVEYWGCSSDN